MGEIQWFRLTLVLVGALLLGAGSVWSYSKVSEAAAAKQLQRWGAALTESTDRCLQREPTAAVSYCRNEHYANLVDVYAAEVGEHQQRAQLALLISVPVAAAVLLLFYALRWAVLGRFRPLWPLHSAKGKL